MVAALDANDPSDRETLRRLFRMKKNELAMMVLRGLPLNPVIMIRNDLSMIQFDMSGFPNYYIRSISYFSGSTWYISRSNRI